MEQGWCKRGWRKRGWSKGEANVEQGIALTELTELYKLIQEPSKVRNEKYLGCYINLDSVYGNMFNLNINNLKNIIKKSLTLVHHIVHFTKCIFVQL